VDVPAATVELRQDLQDDVVAGDSRCEIEAEVRPEAIRVCQQRSLRPSGSARRVDEQQRVGVLDLHVDRLFPAVHRLEPLERMAARLGEYRVLVLDEE
jgi:hypothetical protein